MDHIRHIARAFLIVAAACAAFPSLVSAAWRDFIPTPYENGADMDVFASYETDRYGTGRGGTDWKDLFIKEKLTLSSTGYSYHPRFITYRLSLSGALKQEEYEAAFLGSPRWQYMSGFEYDASLDALPEHPYNLRLYSRRIEPLYKQQFATYSNNVEESWGAIFRYRAKPYFIRARYIDDSIESSLNSNGMKLFGVDGAYFKEFENGKVLSLNATFTHTDFDSSAQGPGDSDEYGISNTIDLKTVSLTSSVSGSGRRQDTPHFGSLQNDQFTWYERLGANLPLNFRTDLTYSYNKADFSRGATGTSPESSTHSVDKRIGLDITHVLFQSLQSRYAFLQDSLSSSGGDTKNVSNSLSMNYTKNIPWGRFLAGFSLGRTVTDSSGAPTVINEQPPPTAVPGGYFDLNAQAVDRVTIRVYLRSPLSPFDLVPLDETVHYTVTSFGNTFRITMNNLPSQFAVPNTYDGFLVSYSLIPAEFKVRTDASAYNVGFELFNMLNPYYSHNSTKTRMLSGEFPGELLDSTVNTLGIVVHKEGFRARAEYQRQDSNIAPYSQWKAEIMNSEKVTETIRVNAAVSYNETSYPHGTSLQGDSAYRVKTAMVSGNIQKQLPSKNLYLSAGGSYSLFSGQTNGSTYSADAALQWKIAKLTLSLGANVSSLESESQGTSAVATSRNHQYYFLNVKRKLF